MRRLCGISVLIAALDQAIKTIVRLYPPGAVILEMPGLLAITHSANTGAAFSLFAGHTALLAAVSAALLGAVCAYACLRLRLTRAAQTALACLLGGGLGNLIDRIAFSGVTDYIRLLFLDFPIFNLADIAITASVALLMALTLTGRLEQPMGEDDGPKDRIDG